MTRHLTPLSYFSAGIVGGIWLLAPAVLRGQEPPRGHGTSRPLFQSLSPGGDSTWIRDVNAMSEGERLRRIGNYRPVESKAAGSNPPAASPAAADHRPGISTVPAPPEARLHPVTPSTGQHIDSAAPPVHSTAPRVRVAPQPTTPSPPVRVVVRRSHSAGSKAAARTHLHQEMAFMPTRNRADYPYAPYRSKAEYEEALAQASWEPATTAPTSKKFRFPNLFRRSASSEEEAPRKSWKIRSRDQSKQPIRSKASSTSSSGLPQADSRRGPVIQTTLFDS